MATKPRIGVVILNWNGKKDTIECLKTVFLSKTPSYLLNVYVVDNASSDNSLDVFAKQFPKAIYIENTSNLGFSGGNNRGIKRALKDGSDYVILLNNDTTVTLDTFEKLVAGARKNKFDIASPKIYFTKGREFHHDQYKESERGRVIWYAGGRIDWPNVIAQHVGVNEVDLGQHNLPTLTEFATGCCMFITKRTLTKVGLLDATFQAYYEDNDYCQRARRLGFKIGYVPQSYLWHKNAGSSGGSGSARQTILVDRSRFTFAMRYAPMRAKLAIIKQHLLTS